MNITETILEYLKSNGSAPVPGFGIFGLENAGAEIVKDKDRILPPSKQVVFTPDYLLDNANFVNYFSKKHNLSAAEALSKLRDQTDYWKKLIAEGKDLEILPLGKFQSSGENLQFKGRKIESENPDFYGLEEIQLSEIRAKASRGSYHLNKTLLWAVFLLALGGLGAAAFLNPEFIFGKKSFENKPEKVTQKTTMPASAALVKNISDSLKTDSLRRDSVKKSATFPAQAKWGGSKQHYKKSKWSKAKRHRSH